MHVTVTDDAYWQKRGRRPVKHQVRQTVNATRALRRLARVDWLAHVDVDEFLWPDADIRALLAAVPDGVSSLRLRAVEAMAPDPADPPPPGSVWYKGCASDRRTRVRETDRIYPRFGPHLNGGFLSHAEGKIFARTGLAGATLRIHNLILGDAPDATTRDCPQIRLCHHHAPDAGTWLAKLGFRLERGAYRPDIRPAPRPDGTPGHSIHDLLAGLQRDGGDAALRDFFHQVCTATPGLRARLDRFGHLYCHNLMLSESRARLFPGILPGSAGDS